MGPRQCSTPPGRIIISPRSSYFHGPQMSANICGMIHGVLPPSNAAFTVVATCVRYQFRDTFAGWGPLGFLSEKNG